MATEQSREHGPLSPLREGEFQRIPGIGPGIEQRLHAAGIQTFHHLAALSPEEISALLNNLVGMKAERIAHQDWPGKARQLAQELVAADPESDLQEPASRQHYTSFMVELLQDDTYNVRRTRVIHVQNNEKDSWAGWDAGRLDRWITAQAAIPAPPASTGGEAKPVEPSVLRRVAPFHLSQVEIFAQSSDRPSRFFSAGQPLEIRLSFSAQPAEPLPGPPAPLLFQAAVYARLPGGQRSLIVQSSGQCVPNGLTTLSIPVEGLEEGAYRLETAVLVYPEDAGQPEREGSSAFAEGMRVHIYALETEATV